MNLYGKLALRIGLGGIIYVLYGLFSMVLGIYVAQDTNDIVTQHVAIILCLLLGGYLARKVYVKELGNHIEFHKYTLYFFLAVLFVFWALAEGMLAYHSLSFITFMQVLLTDTNHFGLNPLAYFFVVLILLFIVSAYFFVAFLCAAFSEWFVIKFKESHAQYKEVRAAVKAYKNGGDLKKSETSASIEETKLNGNKDKW